MKVENGIRSMIITKEAMLGLVQDGLGRRFVSKPKTELIAINQITSVGEVSSYELLFSEEAPEQSLEDEEYSFAKKPHPKLRAKNPRPGCDECDDNGRCGC